MLGHALLRLNRYDEARPVIARALELLAEDDPIRATMVRALDICENHLDLEARLDGLLRGTQKARDAKESLLVADTLLRRGDPAGAARFYEEAFARDPALADDIGGATRYNAACATVLAAANNASDPDARARSRDRARRWLEADLQAWRAARQTEGSPLREQLAPMLGHWRTDPDLATVREPTDLDKLPEAEREPWRSLWRAVDELLGK